MATQTNAPLPEGLEIAGYRIVKKIAAGGFSIVYLATDIDRSVYAIKEYLPSALVQRSAGELVPSIAAENLTTYRVGLKCFFEEGRALARIAHPHVVSVVNFFRAHDTVYMVMQYAEGHSLQETILRHRDQKREPLVSERFIRNVFGQVMDGLREVHTHKLLHLDLKPANIYLRSDGSAMLLDFGAARQILNNDFPRIHPMYTPGFAAPELYEKGGNLGPWTDIYGLGAAMYSCMAGVPPQAADQRSTDDQMDIRLKSLRRQYSPQLLAVIRWCLLLDPAARPQSVFALQKALRDAVPPNSGPGVRRWLRRLYARLSKFARMPIHFGGPTKKVRP